MKIEWIITIIGIVIGAIAGWVYWKFIGCESGTCAITSKPLNSTIYGAILGALLFNAAAPYFKKADKQDFKQQIEKNDTNA